MEAMPTNELIKAVSMIEAINVGNYYLRNAWKAQKLNKKRRLIEEEIKKRLYN